MMAGFARIDADGHDEPVHIGQNSLCDIDMPVGDGIERSRIDSVLHGKECRKIKI